MDAELIRRWNQVVSPKDYVYYVGDFTLSGINYAEHYFKQLNGHVSILDGSHDRWMTAFNEGYPLRTKQGEPVRIIPPVYSLEYLLHHPETGQPLPIVLCHYAMRSWDRSHYGSWHLFGHHHGQLESYGKSFDIGVDAHDFYPWSLEEVKAKLAR